MSDFHKQNDGFLATVLYGDTCAYDEPGGVLPTVEEAYAAGYRHLAGALADWLFFDGNVGELFT